MKHPILTPYMFFFLFSSAFSQNLTVDKQTNEKNVKPVFNQSDTNTKKQVIRMGALASMTSGIKTNDANAAFKVLTESLGKRIKANKYNNFDFEGKIYSDVNSLKTDVDNKIINYFDVSTETYFFLTANQEFVPFLSGTNHPKNRFIQYLLITNINNKVDNLKELSNRKIFISNSSENVLGKYWLKTTLREELGAISYKKISFQSTNQSESQDLLSVFFGKIEFALVSEAAYDLTCELNPAMKLKIKILKRSVPLITSVFAHRRGIDQSIVNVIRDIASDFHNDPNGKQILNLFKINRITQITAKDLVETEKIINKYNNFFK